MKTPETEQPVERHPLKPFVHADTRVLFLGSFPPPKARWCMDFFYPNFINDHWRIEGLVFYQDKNYFVDEGARCFKLDLIVDHCSPAMRPTNFWRWSSLRTSRAWFGIARCCVRLSPLARKPQRHFVPNSTSASCRRWGRVWSCRRCLVSPCSAFRPAPGHIPFP